LVKIGWFPALVLDPQADTWVWGDVFRTDGASLQAFLEYEGLAAEAKEGVDCRLAETQVYSYAGAGWNWKVRLWEWTGPLDQAEAVPSGDWLDMECPKSSPLFTWIGGACVLALPALIASAYYLEPAREWMAIFLGSVGLLAPIAGWVAVHWAARRRERAEVLRAFVIFGLVLASIPCAMALLALLMKVLSGFN
jgi:gamma-glutamylcyclotransferase (GGCT)/AIG2-like uncharacterized protein YtfP